MRCGVCGLPLHVNIGGGPIHTQKNVQKTTKIHTPNFGVYQGRGSQHSVYAKFYSSVVPELGYPFNRRMSAVKSQHGDIQTFQGAEGISFNVPMQ